MNPSQTLDHFSRGWARLAAVCVLGLAASSLWAAPEGVWYLDLSKAANRGFADAVADDGQGGWTDQGREGDLHDFPVGEREFLGVPFRILDPSQNDGRSAVILRGRPRPTWPESASIPANGYRADWLYFLHTSAWAGTDKTRPFAQYEIHYGDGTSEIIPLRVGVETAGWWGPGLGERCLVAWTAKRKAASVGVQAFAWKNPHPEKKIDSIVFRSLSRMTVPILLAVTASSKPLTLKSLPEEAVAPEGALWPKAPHGTFLPPPVDVPKIIAKSLKPLTGPKKKTDSGRLGIHRGHFTDASGRRWRFFGACLPKESWDWTPEARERTAVWLSSCGFNLLRLTWDGADEVRSTSAYIAWRETAAAHHLFLQLSVTAPPESFPATSSASVWGTFWTATMGNGVAPKDDPLLALVSLSAESAEKADQARKVLRDLGVTAPLSAEFAGNEVDVPSWTRSLDYNEGTFFWDEPQKDSDGFWRFSNRSLLTNPDSGLMAKVSVCRAEGKPFIVHVGEGWPNAYACEGPVLQAVMGAFQDWDGLLVKTVWGRWDSTESSMNPLTSLYPAAALLFLRGDVAPAKQTGSVGEEIEETGESAASNLGGWAHSLYAGTGKSRIPVSKADPQLKKVVADNGRWEWQGNIGLFKAGSPKTQVLAGFLSHRLLANYAWDVQSPNPFAAFILTSLTEDGTALSRRLLVSAAGRYEWEDAKFNNMRTALLSGGNGALLMEPVKARVTILRSKADPRLIAKAYDAAGNWTRKFIKLTWKGKNVLFDWPEGASWVLLESI